MDAIRQVNWDTVDYSKIVGDYIALPDGRQRHIEMDMLCWYWLTFMIEEGQTTERVAQHVYDVLAENPDADVEAEFDGMFRTGVLAYGREWVRLSEGR